MTAIACKCRKLSLKQPQEALFLFPLFEVVLDLLSFLGREVQNLEYHPSRFLQVCRVVRKQSLQELAEECFQGSHGLAVRCALQLADFSMGLSHLLLQLLLQLHEGLLVTLGLVAGLCFQLVVLLTKLLKLLSQLGDAFHVWLLHHRVSLLPLEDELLSYAWRWAGEVAISAGCLHDRYLQGILLQPVHLTQHFVEGVAEVWPVGIALSSLSVCLRVQQAQKDCLDPLTLIVLKLVKIFVQVVQHILSLCELILQVVVLAVGFVELLFQLPNDLQLLLARVLELLLVD